jgi:hypothetical protein
MNRSIIFKVIMALVLLGALVGIGAYAYNAGIAQGMLVSLPAPANGSGTAPQPYPYFAYRHASPFFGFGGFGCFGVLIPLFLLFLVFGAFRALFWNGSRRWHTLHTGPWGRSPYDKAGGNIPPMVAEWHRRMHEQPPETKTEQ